MTSIHLQIPAQGQLKAKMNSHSIEYFESTGTNSFEVRRGTRKYDSVHLEDVAGTTNLKVDHTAGEKITVGED